MSILIMDQRRSGLPVVDIVNPKTGNTKLIINEIDLVPGKHILWKDFLEAEKNASEETSVDGAGADVVVKEEPSAAIKRERAARSQREREHKVVVETPAEVTEPSVPAQEEGAAV